MSNEASSVTNDVVIALLREVVSANTARNRQAVLQSAWSPATSLDEIGFDSLDLLELVFLVEERFEVDLDFNANNNINAVKTIEDLRRELEALLADRHVT